MTCQECSDLINGPRPPEDLTTAERQGIARHLHSCPPCRTRIRETATEAMRELPPATVLVMAIKAMELSIKDASDGEA